MSVFNLKIEYPNIDYNWYQVSPTGESKCPANWILESEDPQWQYFNYVGIGWVQSLNEINEDSIKIPIQVGNISDLNKKEFTFSHIPAGTEEYIIAVEYREGMTEYLTYQGEVWETTTLTIPNGSEYIKIYAPESDSGIMSIYINAEEIDFEFRTKDYDINTEQNNFKINTNNKVSRTLDNTLISTSLKNRDVYYSNELILYNSEAKELDLLLDTALLNNLKIDVNINITDKAGFNLANIPSGSLENWVKYHYITHNYSQKTGLYAYVTLEYKNDENNNATYL